MNLEDMLYRGAFRPEHEILFEKIETALGFKLFFWQKTFIIYGTFRRFGKTTAECIRDLVRTDLPPIDFTKRPRTLMEDLYSERNGGNAEKIVGSRNRNTHHSLACSKTRGRTQDRRIGWN